SIPTFEDWRAEARSVEALAAYRHVDFSFSGRGDPRNVPAVRATPELFAVLRARAALGRAFTREEAVPGADRVVVLSHGFWTRQLGADPGIIGQAIRLDAQPYTVIGVMPPAFEFPTGANAEIWAPLAFD